jgi:hypothetical protein
VACLTAKYREDFSETGPKMIETKFFRPDRKYYGQEGDPQEYADSFYRIFDRTVIKEFEKKKFPGNIRSAMSRRFSISSRRSGSRRRPSLKGEKSKRRKNSKSERIGVEISGERKTQTGSRN